MKKLKRLIFIMLLAITALSFTSCLKDTDSKKRAEEKDAINKYLTDNGITATPTASGLYYIEETPGTGATPTNSDFAIINYSAYDLQGNLFDGTNKTQTQQAQVTPVFAIGGPLKVYVGYSLNAGLTEGLKLMKEGGKAKLIMPSIIGYNDYVPRRYEVELVKVISNPDTYERQQLLNFLDTATNLEAGDSINSTNTRSGITGIFYNEKVAGTGTSSPLTGNRVRIRYTGYLTDGRVFDKTDADTAFYFYVGGSAYSKVIDGLDEGIRHMKKGGKATIIIPYYRGYGFDQIVSYNRIVVPYFSTLIFDMELLDIFDNKK